MAATDSFCGLSSCTVRFAESEPRVKIDLYSMDGEHQFFFDVGLYASSGDVAYEFQQAAFEKYKSNDVFESYMNSVLACVSSEGTPRRYNLWESDVQLMDSTEVRAYREEHTMQSLKFQLIRLETPKWENPWKGNTTDWMEAGNYLQEAIDVCGHIKNDMRKLYDFGKRKKKLRDLLLGKSLALRVTVW